MPDRDQVFREFYKQVGSKPFAPEFIDSLIAVMRATEGACWTEQVWAWQRWRSWANSSKYAVSDWNPEKAWYLDQLDCCLDLWWFQQGRDVKWIEGQSRKAREEYRKDFRRKPEDREFPDLVGLKQSVNLAFVKLRFRGNVDFEGRKIYALVSPPAAPPIPKITRTTDFHSQDKEFLEWWKITWTTDFQEFEEARKRYNEARKIQRAAYQRYLDQQTSEAPILIEKIIDNTSSSSVVSVLEEATTTIFPDIPPEELLPPPPNSTGLDLGGGEDGGAPQEVVVDALEEELPDLPTVAEILAEELPPLIAHKGTLTQKQFAEVVRVVEAQPEPIQAVRFYLDEHLPGRLPSLHTIGGVLARTRELPGAWAKRRRESATTAAITSQSARVIEDQYARALNDARELLSKGCWASGEPLTETDRAVLWDAYPELTG